MSVSKRGILRGAVGLVAASTARAEGVPMPGPPADSYPSGLFAGRTGRSLNAAAETLADPVGLARKAAIRLAREQLSKDQDALTRRERSLKRLKSVSPAWIEAQCARIAHEQSALYAAFQEFVGDDYGC